jgi:hypothetical protein
MKNLEKVLNGEDYKSFIAKASDLADLGWDFSGENDAQFFNMDETEFLSNAEVNINVHDDGTTTYLSSPKPCDWQQADAHNETGDDQQTLEDILTLKGKGLIEER